MLVDADRMPFSDYRISSMRDAFILRKEANPYTFSWKWISERVGFLS
jgi:hypothetical protein